MATIELDQREDIGRAISLTIGLSLAPWLLSACAIGPDSFKPEASVHLRVLDEEGRPVTHATVWMTTSPCSILGTARSDICFDPDELRRVAGHLRESFEYKTATAGVAPYEQFEYVGGSDTFGVWYDKGTLRSTWGMEPPSFRGSVMFAVFKQGYVPAVTEIKMNGGTLLAIRSTVTLMPDREFPREENVLRRRFESLLQETYAMQRQKHGLSSGVPRELIEIQRDLEEVAQRAEAAGDRKLAARAYYRLAYMPRLLYSPTNPQQVIGYASDQPDSVKKDLVERARLLDPSSARFARPTLFMERTVPRNASADQSESATARYDELMKGIDQTIRPVLPKLWPEDVGVLYQVYVSASRFDDACHWILEVAKAHPKYSGTERNIRRVASQSAAAGRPVPSECAR